MNNATNILAFPADSETSHANPNAAPCTEGMPPIFRVTALDYQQEARCVRYQAHLFHDKVSLTVEWARGQPDTRLHPFCLVSPRWRRLSGKMSRHRNKIIFVSNVGKAYRSCRSSSMLSMIVQAEQCELAFRPVSKYSSRSNDSISGWMCDRNGFSAVGALRNSTDGNRLIAAGCIVMGSKAGIRVERTLGASTHGLEVGQNGH
ncbi:MAG: hypothetical protein HO274_01090 [Ferrovum myxofaciens]|uniref:hypothetical protein n=1 Tax=Ferrovum myxofaciens TaxID=416213 RepID=UPI002353C87B|nr:hypothetical protein [Ferrovum myxofaciens]QKE40082.1 MAG: hypothetical protein HO274_01090 [Ferrovum myxofaciens]